MTTTEKDNISKDSGVAEANEQPDQRKSKKKPSLQYDMHQLDDWADVMRQEIEIKDYPSGWFGGVNAKCGQGKEILGWIKSHIEQDQK